MNPQFFQRVNALCAICPASWESGDRTPQHNARVGGAPNSWHVKQQAIDLVYDTPEELQVAAQEAIRQGFMGVEMDLTNLHLHLDGRTSRWWVVKDAQGYHDLADYLTQLKPSATV